MHIACALNLIVDVESMDGNIRRVRCIGEMSA
jgi:hypothetical protein